MRWKFVGKRYMNLLFQFHADSTQCVVIVTGHLRAICTVWMVTSHYHFRAQDPSPFRSLGYSIGPLCSLHFRARELSRSRDCGKVVCLWIECADFIQSKPTVQWLKPRKLLSTISLTIYNILLPMEIACQHHTVSDHLLVRSLARLHRLLIFLTSFYSFYSFFFTAYSLCSELPALLECSAALAHAQSR